MTKGTRGPARSEQARVAILRATAQQFTERGYDHLTMEGIAAAAHVGKQTIYRWWPSKGALVAECLLEGMLLPEKLVPPTTGDLREDLVTWLDEIFALLAGPRGEDLLRSLIAAAAEHAVVGRRLRDSLGAASSLVERLEAGIQAGQLRQGAPVEEISDALVGALIVQALSRDPIAVGTPRRLVDLVIGSPY